MEYILSSLQLLGAGIGTASGARFSPGCIQYAYWSIMRKTYCRIMSIQCRPLPSTIPALLTFVMGFPLIILEYFRLSSFLYGDDS